MSSPYGHNHEHSDHSEESAAAMIVSGLMGGKRLTTTTTEPEGSIEETTSSSRRPPETASLGKSPVPCISSSSSSSSEAFVACGEEKKSDACLSMSLPALQSMAQAALLEYVSRQGKCFDCPKKPAGCFEGPKMPGNAVKPAEAECEERDCHHPQVVDSFDRQSSSSGDEVQVKSQSEGGVAAKEEGGGSVEEQPDSEYASEIGESSSDVDPSGDEDEGDNDEGPAPKRRRRAGADGPEDRHPSGRRTRTRKLAPATVRAHRARDDAVRRRDVAESHHRAALAELERARRRAEAAADQVRLADRVVDSAEEAVVDAELVDPSNEKWNDSYRKLMRFHEENGHCLVENTEEPETKALGRFIAAQRALHKIPAGESWRSLHRKPYRIRALKRIDFVFDRNEERWMENYGRLLEYREKYGDIDVVRGRDVALYLWIGTQLEQYRLYIDEDEGVRATSRLTERRAALLDEVGARERLAKIDAELGGRGSTVTNAHDARWERRFHELAQFKEKNGHVDVRESGPLKKWAADQRTLLRAHRDGRRIAGCKMTDERAAKLEGLGLKLDLKEARWTERFRELVAYRAQHGDCLVPHNYEENKQLGTWVEKLRSAYRRLQKVQEEDGTTTTASCPLLTTERIDALNELGFVWNPARKRKKSEAGGPCMPDGNNGKGRNGDYWMVRYHELKAFRDANDGSCVVPHHANTPLYTWCYRQKREYSKVQEGKKSTLSQERVKLLDEIGFWESGSVLAQRWRDNYDQLLKYKEAHGDCVVPSGHKLIHWMHRQRAEYRMREEGKPSSLTTERLDLLKKAGFVFKTCNEEIVAT